MTRADGLDDKLFGRIDVHAIDTARCVAERLVALERAELPALRAAFLETQAEATQRWAGRARGVGTAPEDELTLNVGGVLMYVRRALLMPRAHPVMSEIWSGRWDGRFLRDRNGHVFLDLDPAAFSALHAYLLDCDQPAERRRTLPKLAAAEPPLAAIIALFHLHEDFLPPHTPMDFLRARELLPPSLEKHRPLVLDAIGDAIGDALGTRPSFRRVYTASTDGWSTAALDKCGADARLLIVMTGSDGSAAAAFCDAPWSKVADEPGTPSPRALVFQATDGHELLVLRANSSEPEKMALFRPSSESYPSTSTCALGVGMSMFGLSLDTRTFSFWLDNAHAENEANPARHALFGESWTASLSEVVAYAFEAHPADEVAAARSELAQKLVVPAPSQLEKGSASLDAACGALGALGAHFASAVQHELAAVALERAELRAEEASFARCEAAVAFLSMGSTDDIVRLKSGSLIDVRRSVLTTCGDPPSQLARQFACDAAWRSEASVWIEADSTNYRRLLNFLRIRSMPAALCAGLDPAALAARLVRELSAEERPLFEKLVECYFPGDAAAFVLS